MKIATNVTPEEIAELPAPARNGSANQRAYDALVASLTPNGDGVRIHPEGEEGTRGMALAVHHAASRANIKNINVRVMPDKSLVVFLTGEATPLVNKVEASRNAARARAAAKKAAKEAAA